MDLVEIVMIYLLIWLLFGFVPMAILVFTDRASRSIIVYPPFYWASVLLGIMMGLILFIIFVVYWKEIFLNRRNPDDY